MKSEKGVALTSIIIYIIIMLIVIAIMSTFTTFFYNNVDDIGKQSDPSKEITRFSSFFIDDINKSSSKVLECGTNSDYIILSDGTQYTFKNNSIYRGKVKICENINSLSFEYDNNDEEKNVVYVKYKLTDGTEEKSTKYTLIN